jgi:acyl carrier protein
VTLGIQERVCAAVAAIHGSQIVGLDDHLRDDLGFKSLDVIEAIVSVQLELGILLPSCFVPRTVRELADAAEIAIAHRSAE